MVFDPKGYPAPQPYCSIISLEFSPRQWGEGGGGGEELSFLRNQNVWFAHVTSVWPQAFLEPGVHKQTESKSQLPLRGLRPVSHRITRTFTKTHDAQENTRTGSLLVFWGEGRSLHLSVIPSLPSTHSLLRLVYLFVFVISVARSLF